MFLACVGLTAASASAQSVITWDFDSDPLGTIVVAQSSSTANLSGVVSSTATGSGAGITPSGGYKSAFLSSNVFTYIRFTTTTPIILEELTLKGNENDPLASLNFAVELSPEGAPVPTQAAPGTGYATLGDFDVTSGALQDVSILGSPTLLAGTYNIRLRVTTPPATGTSALFIDDVELSATTTVVPLITWDFDSDPLGTIVVPHSSAPVNLSGEVSSTATGSGAGITPSGGYKTSFLSSNVFTYIRFTTTTPITLAQVQLNGNENDPLASLNFAVELSPKGAPAPTQASPGTGYTTFGDFDVTSGALQSVVIHGSQLLLPGTYNIRLRVTTPPQTGTSALVIDDVKLSVSGPLLTNWDFENAPLGTHVVPQSSAPVGISGEVSSTATGSGSEIKPGGTYGTAFLSSTVFTYIRFTTVAPITLDALRLKGNQNDFLPSLNFDVDISAEGAPVPTQAAPGSGYTLIGNFDLTGGALQSISIDAGQQLAAGTYNIRMRVTSPPAVGTSQFFMDDVELEARAGLKPVLSVSNLFTGGLATVDVTGATPGGLIFPGMSVTGNSPLALPIGLCGPLVIQLSLPITLLAAPVADGFGVSSYGPIGIPPGLTGITLYFHALDLEACVMTNALTKTIG
ncbi:MAG: hypothetical protein ACJAZ8_001898 [Planctomycetota bacterium]|jgi:hypothetical protein